MSIFARPEPAWDENQKKTCIPLVCNEKQPQLNDDERDSARSKLEYCFKGLNLNLLRDKPTKIVNILLKECGYNEGNLPHDGGTQAFTFFLKLFQRRLTEIHPNGNPDGETVNRVLEELIESYFNYI